MILIIGSPEEAHSVFIYDKIKARGEKGIYFDTRLFPAHSKISLFPAQENLGIFHTLEGERISLSSIKSVYWRYYMGIGAQDDLTDPSLQKIVNQEIGSFIGSMFRILDDCLWVNSPAAIDMHI